MSGTQSCGGCFLSEAMTTEECEEKYIESDQLPNWILLSIRLQVFFHQSLSYKVVLIILLVTFHQVIKLMLLLKLMRSFNTVKILKCAHHTK